MITCIIPESIAHNRRLPKLFSASVAATMMLSTVPALSQSSFLYGNHIPGQLDAPVLDGEGNRLFGSTYVAMLYGGETSNSLTPARDLSFTDVLPPVPFTVLVDGQAGYFRDGVAVVRSSVCGNTAWLQLRAWDLRLGATYEDVMALGLGGYGESAIFQAQGGNPCLAPPGPAKPLIGLESFSLRPVPEPSLWTLLVLGGLVVWWAVRRPRQQRLSG